VDHRQSFDVFRSVIKILETGEPVPLHWAIAHAEEFTAAWLFTVEIHQLLEIATYVIPRVEVMRAICALIRDRCPDLGRESRAIAALETMEEWANGRATGQAVFNAGYLIKPLADGTHAALPFHTVFGASHLPTAPVGLAAGFASLVGTNIQAMTAATDDAEHRTALADFVRQQFAHRDVLADIVNANRKDRTG
jgi:hypothetical protein